MLNRLTSRLVLSHLLVIAVAMALLGFLLLSFVQEYFEQSLEESLLVQARLVSRGLTAAAPLSLSNVSQALLPPASNTLQQQSQNRAFSSPDAAATPVVGLDSATLQITSKLDTRVRLVDSAGVIVADSAGSDAGRGVEEDPLIAAALQGREGARIEADEVRVAAPLWSGSDVTGAVYLTQPLRDLARLMTDLRARLALSAGIALVFSALAGLLLARAIARPVNQLTAAADHLARGDFAYPLTVTSPDELARLAVSFASMRDELHRTLQARTDLVANVSHELRTPLTAIKGLTETLRDGAIDDLEARDHFLASIESQADRLIRLVNDLLLLSRADAQALHLRRDSLDLTALVRQTAGELAPQAAGHDVSLIVDGPPCTICGDADRLRQIVVNLLDNAIRYSPSGGVVGIRIAQANEQVRVTIHDDGPGIAPADLPRVFERFYRADRSRRRDPSLAAGSGLGLAIAKMLVEAHGGAIALESAPGAGATVHLTLPAG